LAAATDNPHGNYGYGKPPKKKQEVVVWAVQVCLLLVVIIRSFRSVSCQISHAVSHLQVLVLVCWEVCSSQMLSTILVTVSTDGGDFDF
jgi:hypothetical protein